MKGAHHRKHKEVAPLPSTRTNGLHASDQYATERERAVSFRLVKQRDGSRSVKFGKILCNLIIFSCGGRQERGFVEMKGWGYYVRFFRLT